MAGSPREVYFVDGDVPPDEPFATSPSPSRFADREDDEAARPRPRPLFGVTDTLHVVLSRP